LPKELQTIKKLLQQRI